MFETTLLVLLHILYWHENSISAMASISLKLSNTLTDCENGYIEIRCIIDSALVKEIISVSLRRFDGEDASVLNESKLLATLSKVNNVLVDTEIANRSEVAVNSSISDGGLSYLSITIMGSVVKPLKDKGPYQCYLMGFNTKYGLIIENSTLEMLNITGNITITLCVFICPRFQH